MLLDAAQIGVASNDRRANRKGRSMKRICMALAALALLLAPLLAPMQASAQDKLVVSVWGGSWRDMVDNFIGKKFTAATLPADFCFGRLLRSRRGPIAMHSRCAANLPSSLSVNQALRGHAGKRRRWRARDAGQA